MARWDGDRSTVAPGGLFHRPVFYERLFLGELVVEE